MAGVADGSGPGKIASELPARRLPGVEYRDIGWLASTVEANHQAMVDARRRIQ